MSANSKKALVQTYRILVANYLVKGEEWTDLPDGSRIRNRIRLRLGAFDMEIVRTPENFDLTVAAAKGHFNYTTDILVHNVRPEQRKRVDALIDEVTELLSFATMSQVVRFGDEYGTGSSQQAVKGLTLYFRPTLGATHGAEVKRFLELTWPAYHLLRRRRMLNVVVDYVVTTELPHLPVELEILMAFVTLECLKSTYAKQAGYKFVAPAWRKISIPPKPNPKNEPTAGFEKLVREMLKAVGMRNSLKRIIGLRNHIVHNGVSPRPLKSQIKAGFYTKEIIREYLLRLLGFKGQYSRFNDMSYHTIK